MFWSTSGGVCCFPDCTVMCVLPAKDGSQPTIIGEIAHIEAKSDSGPRANPGLSEQARDGYSNLILLCPNHHTLVDKQAEFYPPETLRLWKTARETTMRTHLNQTMPTITVAELEVVTQALVNTGGQPTDDFSLVAPRDKMRRNGLTERTESLFSIGLVQSKQVEEYVEAMGSVDRNFVSRLTSGFVNEYQQQVTAGLEGDGLFARMREFSAQGRTELGYQCAGLAVLVYLFERCEVFEQ